MNISFHRLPFVNKFFPLSTETHTEWLKNNMKKNYAYQTRFALMLTRDRRDIFLSARFFIQRQKTNRDLYGQ